MKNIEAEVGVHELSGDEVGEMLSVGGDVLEARKGRGGQGNGNGWHRFGGCEWHVAPVWGIKQAWERCVVGESRGQINRAPFVKVKITKAYNENGY